MSLTNKINELQANSVPRRELVQAQESLDRANRLLEEVRADLEYHKAEWNKTKVQLAEAKAHLADANFLAEEFKKTDEYIISQNQMWEDGARWAVRRMRKHVPTLDKSIMRNEISAMIADPGSYPASEGSSRGRKDMDDGH